MATLKVKQVKSKINRPADQKKTLQALGLRKMNQVVEHTDTPQIRGMVRKVAHLIEVEEVK
ncbi:MAG: 50S ribosomal protein L30 [Owenweeksia sp.]